MDDDVWVIVPFGTIAIIVLVPIFMGIGFVEAVRTWFITNLYSIIEIAIIVSVMIALISGTYLRSIGVFIASLFCFSQAIFFLVYCGTKLPEHGSGLAVIGNLFIFVVYVVLAGLDIFGSCALPISGVSNTRGTFSTTIEESADNTISSCVILGIIGWVIDIILLIGIS